MKDWTLMISSNKCSQNFKNPKVNSPYHLIGLKLIYLLRLAIVIWKILNTLDTGTVLIVQGEEGVGKSRFVNELSQLFQTRIKGEKCL